jgi:Kdo2-lipid IVA lauroyltransferase/acyltransferase
MVELKSGRNRKKRRKGRTIEWLEYSLFRAVQGGLRLLGPRGVRRLGMVLGTAAFRVARKRSRLVAGNLEQALPEIDPPGRREIARGCWQHFATETLEYVRTIGASPEQIEQTAEIGGREHLEAVLTTRRGFILYTAHFGAWETAISLVGSVDMRFSVVARPLDNQRLETLLERSRKRFGVEMVPRRNAARVLMRALSRGEGVIVLPDQAVSPREGILVPFIGRPAWTTPAPARLALRFGVPLLGVFCYRRGERVVAELTPPIMTEGLSSDDATVRELTERINDTISDRIRRDPELWLWMHDRWKRAQVAQGKG